MVVFQGKLHLFDGLITRIPLETIRNWKVNEGVLEINYFEDDKELFNLKPADLERFIEQMSSVLEPASSEDGITAQ